MNYFSDTAERFGIRRLINAFITGRKRESLIWWLFLSTVMAAALAGCSSPRSGKTHDPTLLDDKVTAQRVSAAVQSGGPEFKNVKVTANNGHVVLSGTVQSPEAKERAERLAKAVPRVTHLDDNLEVSSIPSPTGRQSQ